MSEPQISEAARDAAEKIDEYCSPTHCGLTLEEHAEIVQRAIDRATAQAVAERDTLKKRLDAELLDWAETDTAVREAALRVLTPFEVNGDTHGVPCVTDIVDVLVKRAEACKPLVEALVIETQNHLPECACAACKALAAHARAHGGAP